MNQNPCEIAGALDAQCGHYCGFGQRAPSPSIAHEIHSHICNWTSVARVELLQTPAERHPFTNMQLQHCNV